MLVCPQENLLLEQAIPAYRRYSAYGLPQFVLLRWVTRSLRGPPLSLSPKHSMDFDIWAIIKLHLAKRLFGIYCRTSQYGYSDVTNLPSLFHTCRVRFTGEQSLPQSLLHKGIAIQLVLTDKSPQLLRRLQWLCIDPNQRTDSLGDWCLLKRVFRRITAPYVQGPYFNDASSWLR